MSRFSRAIATVLLLGVLWPMSVPAAAYLKLGDIKGESTAAAHAGWIELDSFSHGITNQVDAASGLPTGKRQHKPFVVTKPVDKSSPLLLGLATRGGVVPVVRLDFVNPASGRRYYQVTLENVLVTSYQTSGSGGDARLVDSFSLNYEEIKWTYTEFDKDGLADRDHAYFWNLMTETGEADEVPAGSFRVSGGGASSGGGEGFQLRWTGFEESTYRIFASPVVTGPYEFVRDYTPTADGEQELNLPLDPRGMFYRIEKLPAR